MHNVDESFIDSLNHELEYYLEKIHTQDLPSQSISAAEIARLISNLNKILDLQKEKNPDYNESYGYSTLELILRPGNKDLIDIMENTPDAVCIIKESVFVFVNKAFLKLFMYTDQNELIGKNALLLIASEEIEKIEDTYSKRVTGEKLPGDFQTIVTKRDGTKFEVNVLVSQIMLKDGKAFLYVVEDLSQKKRVEEELRISEQKYRLLAENSKDVIWILGFDKKFSYVSPSVFDLRGFTPEEVMQQSLEEAVCPESLQVINERIKVLDYYFKSGKKFTDTPVDEIEQYRKDGTRVWTEVITKVIYDKNDNPVSILGVSRNIDRKKKSESELMKYAEELRVLNSTKDKFFSIIAHDLKNPFNVLLGLSEYLIEDFSSISEEEKLSVVTEINKVSKRSYGLLENLLTWSRCQSGTLQPSPVKFDLNICILNCIYLLSGISKNKNIQVVKGLSEDIEVYADKEMIETVLRNLLTNAIKFTNPDGFIKIDCKKEGIDAIVSVTDNGIGISDDVLPTLFSVDVPVSHKGTSNEPGSGLGLILCKEFVEINGGIIWVRSKVKEGSNFSFTIPLADPSSP